MHDALENWREEIDHIDQDILVLIAKRVKIIEKIGKYKKEKRITFFDKNRWSSLLSSLVKKAEGLNLDSFFIADIFTILHKYSLKIQEEIK